MNRAVPLISLTLLCAACAPTVYLTPDPIGPAEMQRYSDNATNTAVAVLATGTQDARRAALATATDVSARQTATAVRGATLDALEARQTDVALDLTQGAGLADATDAASIRTQSAAQTRAWATPSAVAVRTQAAVDSATVTREQAAAEATTEFWQTLRVVLLAVVGVLGAVGAVLLWCWGQARIRAEELRQKAAVARDAFRLLAPGHWAEWAPDDGYQVYTLPGQLDAPPTVIENAPAGPSRVHTWRQAVRLFCWWGDRYGFGIASLGPAGVGVVSDPDWRILSKLLKGAGVLAEVPIDGKKGRTTAWAPEWGFARLADELGHGRLALPFPSDDEAPKVAFAVPTQHQN